ncbi:MAG: sigma-70 family RNA polymerase sigma factor [Ruminococcaceae bacterium]|nr:sigma-70 family RNA polymerase sigma factor [Oscillospiraceae bacterium]
MDTINLRDFYYWCKEDIFVEITEEMLEAMKAADRQESAYKRRTYRYKGHYTLDMGDGIENECVVKPETPEEIYIREETEKILLSAIGKLTEAQQRRLMLHFFDGMRYSQIARMEGVTDGSISGSIKSALKHLSKQKEVKQFKE